MSAQVAADLRAAAEVLRRDGWTQGKYHKPINGNMCHCAVGAIEAATGYWTAEDGYADGRTAENSRVAVAWRVMWRHLGLPDPMDVYDWNDAGSRTADEVIAALEAAATAAAEAQAQPQSGNPT